MKNASYGYTKKVSYDFDTAVQKIKKSLKENNFGIISEINITAKIKEKLGKDMEHYLILGACNPKLAFDALQAETEIGLLLPCNVIVYQKNKEIFISAIVPSVAMGFLQNPALKYALKTVEPALKKSIDNC